MALTRQFKRISFALIASAIIGGAYLVGAQLATLAAQEASARQLQIIGLDVESILERYETLPFALSFQNDAALALQQPESTATIDKLNHILKSIQLQAKVAAIYLMDTKGKTIAASNWDNKQSYVAKNFGFRPYFLDALHGKAGRFYGIGSTTAEPGYFIAQPVYAALDDHGNTDKTPIGVMAVKISLNDFASAWRSIVEPVTLTDRWGVIFLSNRPAWQYHSLDGLTPDAQHEIANTLQYVGHQIQPVRSLPGKVQAGFGTPVSHPVGRLGWQLMTFPNQHTINRHAMLWAMAAALLMGIAGISILASHQRKRRLEERGQARAALQSAAEDLDRKIVLRTAELTTANQSIESKYAKLKEAEHLLRNTQNELVQAGKLTMLGQMAAGVTHELSQPLTAIRAFSDNARTFLERGQADKAAENLSLISAASERMGAIIGQLKGFARKSDASASNLAPVNLAQSIRTSARLLESDFQRCACDLQISIADEVQVIGDALRIEQVLINLLRNALEAAETSVQKSVVVDLAVEQNHALIRIHDSGGGIASDVATRLFEPFYTTKASGKGLGLGLAISSSIVQAMNGQLSAKNHPDGGAEFTLSLPLPLLSTAQHT
ncbi:MAG: ATP-binding protein [Undibacterium sp.]|nr:ATP-binding protein [Undibacterium sp.]